MERRKFLSWVSVGILASSLPVVIAACNSETEEAETETSPEAAPTTEGLREDGFMVAGTTAELEQAGYLLQKKNDLIVVRSEDNNLAAVSPACTHKGCTVEWDGEAKNLVCPCHGSKFAPNGEVLKGPAQEPLPTYEVKEEEGSILVKT
ncbi:MAG: Rieske (2Fe-2S) protein [Spirulinaceae cyanobacterium]